MLFRSRMGGSGIIRLRTDGSFAAHQGMRGHAGMVASAGKGAAISSSSKQKISTRSSTECEIIAVDEAITKPLWLRHLLEAQGQTVVDCVLFQDNQASIRIEKNGFHSVGKRTKHFDVKYFFITDLAERGEVSIEYCPALELVADALTKPLQGSLFQTHRNAIMGIDADQIPVYNKKAREHLMWLGLLVRKAG